jgi:Fur family zinc uptake transcriptional regulator
MASDLSFELTRNQRAILSRLRSAGKPLGAYAILERVRDVGILYPSSVYRALNDLMRFGLVRPIKSLGLFVACKQAHRDHRIGFVICSGCRKVIEVPLRSDQQALLESFSHEGIRIESLVTLEFAGLCRACGSTSAKPRRPSSRTESRAAWRPPEPPTPKRRPSRSRFLPDGHKLDGSTREDTRLSRKPIGRARAVTLR